MQCGFLREMNLKDSLGLSFNNNNTPRSRGYSLSYSCLVLLRPVGIGQDAYPLHNVIYERPKVDHREYNDIKDD